jgi:hypothetical protein
MRHIRPSRRPAPGRQGSGIIRIWRRDGFVLKQVVRVCAVVAAFWTGLALSEETKKPFTADSHKQRELACTACHSETKPTTTASPEACLTCHQSIEAVAEKTANRKPNPHKNHVTEASDLECTQCHHGHKADAPMCHQCHIGMEFEKKEAETK